eukprot:4013507-Amphidinium_carterae.1
MEHRGLTHVQSQEFSFDDIYPLCGISWRFFPKCFGVWFRARVSSNIPKAVSMACPMDRFTVPTLFT